MARRWDGKSRPAWACVYAGPAARTMSASSTIARHPDGVANGARLTSRHQVVDRMERGVVEDTGQVRVDGGGLGAGVPEVLLDQGED